MPVLVKLITGDWVWFRVYEWGVFPDWTLDAAQYFPHVGGICDPYGPNWLSCLLRLL